MLADFLTKPLQGSLFKKFWDVLMGYQHTNTLMNFNSNSSSLEERVGDKNKNEKKCSHQISVQKKENETKDSNVRETDEFEITPQNGEENEKGKTDGSSTSEQTHGTWSLEVAKNQKHYQHTANPHTKIVKKDVYKVSHNFVNNPL
jgi:hypothetical protein